MAHSGTGKGLLTRPAISSNVRWKGQKLRPDSEGSRKSLYWTSGKALLPSMRDASLVAAAWRMDWRKVGWKPEGRLLQWLMVEDSSGMDGACGGGEEEGQTEQQAKRQE